jgi:replicative DNA helicase
MSEAVDDTETTFEFDQDFQHKIAHLFIRDPVFAQRSIDLLKPEYFEETAVGAVVRLVQDHVKTYRTVPDVKIIPTILKEAFDKKRIRPDLKEEVVGFIKEAMGFDKSKHVDLSNPDFVLEKVRDFAKATATEQAMVEIVTKDLVGKKDWAGIEKMMKEAAAVGTLDDTGEYDYWKEIENRSQKRKDINDGKILRSGISTGYPGMDAHMYHGGWGRKELSCMMGAAKAGKSMSLGDFGKNASLLGYNVYYDSLEVSTEIIGDRVDAALSDTFMMMLNKEYEEVERRIKAAHAAAGEYRMRDHATGTLKPSALHRILEKYRADGIIFDLVIVDYADIMASEYRSDSLQENLRTIYIDLRALAFETGAAFLTATQTNRDGAKTLTAKATDVGDDFNKVRTVDLLIGINATDAEKKAGEARLYWAASRNSSDGFSLRIRQERDKMKFLTAVIGKE